MVIKPWWFQAFRCWLQRYHPWYYIRGARMYLRCGAEEVWREGRFVRCNVDA